MKANRKYPLVLERIARCSRCDIPLGNHSGGTPSLCLSCVKSELDRKPGQRVYVESRQGHYWTVKAIQKHH